MAQLDLNDVAMFVRVVDRAGFAKVARELRVPTSTVSRAVARLEESLETRLVQRTTRSVHATADGRAFYADVAPAVAALQHAARGVEGADRAPRGRLRITAPNDIGSTFLADVVVEFTERYPRVDVELILTTRTMNLVEEEVDLALRAGRLADSSLVARKLGDLEADIYASTEYVRSRGVPASLEELAQHACILFRPRDGKVEWTLHGPEGEVRHEVHGRIGGDDFSFVRAAVLAGGGIALVPRIVAAADVASGRLVRVLPRYVMRTGALHVVHPSARNIPAKVAVFRDFVVDAFARMQLAATADKTVRVARAAKRRGPAKSG